MQTVLAMIAEYAAVWDALVELVACDSANINSLAHVHRVAVAYQRARAVLT